MEADVHDLNAKVITVACTVLHAPIQVCLGALHYTLVLVLHHHVHLQLTLIRKLCEPGNISISYGTLTELLYLLDHILCTWKALTAIKF